MKLSDNQKKVIMKAVKTISEVLDNTGSVDVRDDHIYAFKYPYANGVSVSIQLARPYLNQIQKEGE